MFPRQDERERWRSRIVGHAELRPADITTHPLNWRTHPRAQHAALAGVLDEVGWVQQVIVNRRTGRLVDGHLRVEAARRRGEPTIPVLYVDLDESEEALVLATLDPIASMARADAELTSAVLAQAHTAVPAVEELLASVARQAETALSPLSSGIGDPDEAPALRDPVTCEGDIWLLGEHRIICGDTTDSAVLSRLMAGDHGSWMWTDPPYGVGYVGGTGEQLTILNDNAAGLEELLAEAFRSVDPQLENGAALYVAHPSGRLAPLFLDAFTGAGWYLHQQLIWLKDRLVPGRSDYQYRHEPILYGWKGHGRTWVGGRSQATVFEAPRPVRNAEHPTMKPVALIEHHIANSTMRGAVGIDPFAGSGSTLIAAERLGRRCRAVELDPRYVDVAVRRWETFTGRPALLADDGRNYSTIEEVRHGR